MGSLRLLSGILDTSVALTYWISLSPFWLREGKWFDSIGAAGCCSSFLLLTLTGDFGGDSEVGLLTKNYWLNDSGLRKTKLTFLAQYDYVICYKEKQGSSTTCTSSQQSWLRNLVIATHFAGLLTLHYIEVPLYMTTLIFM